MGEVVNPGDVLTLIFYIYAVDEVRIYIHCRHVFVVNYCKSR